MDDIAYDVEHSVEARVSLAFAWQWRTDIQNWHDPPAQFSLDGSFAAGSTGTTLLPGQDPLQWQIREVRPGRWFIIEMQLDRATLGFEWRFDRVSDQRTRITQRIVLTGANAAAYTTQLQEAFGSSLADGMNRIATALEEAAEASSRQASRRARTDPEIRVGGQGGRIDKKGS